MGKFIRCFVLVVALGSVALGQWKSQGLGGGIGFGGLFGQTDAQDKEARFQARGFLRYGLMDHLHGEFGAGLGKVAGPNYEAVVVPIDYRFVFSPLAMDSWNPYFYGGAGALYYNIEKPEYSNGTDLKKKDWTTFFPVGVGIQFPLKDQISFEMSGGFNFTSTNNLNGYQIKPDKDNYWSFLIGLTLSGEDPNADPDGDGLSNAQEKQLGTNPKVADTDGDGLSDGDEVNLYKSSPLSTDSDGDKLLDGDEVKTTHTDPNKADTDGDGLSDADEVTKYKTDPNKADTDGDGLNDGDEILKYKTDPLKADTDGDGLRDGEEVNRYKTDPLKADTDGGTVNDGTEVEHGTDPLNPADDIPKKEELKVEVGKSIVLDGVVFATGKSDISPESEEVLTKAFNTLEQNPDIEVEIQGHTDNVGKKAANVKLSVARANAVKDWLVKKGIAAARVATNGFGPDKPVSPNTTADGRQKNRRIEFFRVK